MKKTNQNMPKPFTLFTAAILFGSMFFPTPIQIAGVTIFLVSLSD